MPKIILEPEYIPERKLPKLHVYSVSLADQEDKVLWHRKIWSIKGRKEITYTWGSGVKTISRMSRWVLKISPNEYECLIHHVSSCITCPTFYNNYFINISIKSFWVHITHLCLKPKSYLPHNVRYNHVLRHQDFLLFSRVHGPMILGS